METVMRRVHPVEEKFEEVLLPTYLCHKVVRAAQILAVGVGSAQGMTRLALAGGAHVEVTSRWMQTKGAVAGGYYVQYEDGYSSFSPAEAFEGGYTLMSADSGVVPVIPDATATTEEGKAMEATTAAATTTEATGALSGGANEPEKAQEQAQQ